MAPADVAQTESGGRIFLPLCGGVRLSAIIPPRSQSNNERSQRKSKWVARAPTLSSSGRVVSGCAFAFAHLRAALPANAPGHSSVERSFRSVVLRSDDFRER